MAGNQPNASIPPNNQDEDASTTPQKVVDISGGIGILATQIAVGSVAKASNAMFSLVNKLHDAIVNPQQYEAPIDALEGAGTNFQDGTGILGLQSLQGFAELLPQVQTGVKLLLGKGKDVVYGVGKDAAEFAKDMGTDPEKCLISRIKEKSGDLEKELKELTDNEKKVFEDGNALEEAIEKLGELAKAAGNAKNLKEMREAIGKELREDQPSTSQ